MLKMIFALYSHDGVVKHPEIGSFEVPRFRGGNPYILDVHVSNLAQFPFHVNTHAGDESYSG